MQEISASNFPKGINDNQLVPLSLLSIIRFFFKISLKGTLRYFHPFQYHSINAIPKKKEDKTLPMKGINPYEPN